MEAPLKNIFIRFEEIRNNVDQKCNTLHELHHKHTVCCKGCDECCMNFNLLPVEFYAISEKIKGMTLAVNQPDNEETCPFLLDHSCQIYEYRPLICRSHGLPILNMDEEGENWELSFCPLNFKDVDEEEYFTNENCYEQDVYNSELFMLNLRFIEAFKEVKYTGTDMLSLQELAQKAVTR